MPNIIIAIAHDNRQTNTTKCTGLVQPEKIGALAALQCRNQALGITMEVIQVNAACEW